MVSENKLIALGIYLDAPSNHEQSTIDTTKSSETFEFNFVDYTIHFQTDNQYYRSEFNIYKFIKTSTL